MRDRDGTKGQSGSSDNWFANEDKNSAVIRPVPVRTLHRAWAGNSRGVPAMSEATHKRATGDMVLAHKPGRGRIY